MFNSLEIEQLLFLLFYYFMGFQIFDSALEKQISKAKSICNLGVVYVLHVHIATHFMHICIIKKRKSLNSKSKSGKTGTVLNMSRII